MVVTEGRKASTKTGRLESHCPSTWWGGDGGMDGIRQVASGANPSGHGPHLPTPPPLILLD